MGSLMSFISPPTQNIEFDCTIPCVKKYCGENPCLCHVEYNNSDSDDDSDDDNKNNKEHVKNNKEDIK
tara:strand:+ start:8616 stop:8819 length:204 start_codon:yes stop_codon:yes gene_type:complete